jgi:predicted phage baseplate assembly protein
LQHTPVIANSEVIEVHESPEGAATSSQKWERVEDFDNSGYGERHYVINWEEGEIRFGDGAHGRIPPAGCDIRAAFYRSGGGGIGNVKQFAVDRILTTDGSNMCVKNHQPAKGGAAAERLEEAKARARNDLRQITRAVTSADYEALALATPGVWVKRAWALPGYHPHYPCFKTPGVVTVVVIPYTLPESRNATPQPDQRFLGTVYHYLQRFRLLTANIFVVPPAYVKVSVRAGVKIKSKTDPGRIKGAIEKALKEFLDPATGGPGETGWPFGHEVLVSEVYQMMQKVEGVYSVNNVCLSAEGENVKKVCDNIKIPANAVVYSGEHRLELQ